MASCQPVGNEAGVPTNFPDTTLVRIDLVSLVFVTVALVTVGAGVVGADADAKTVQIALTATTGGKKIFGRAVAIATLA